MSFGHFTNSRAFLVSQYARATSYTRGFAFQQRKEVLMANITATVQLENSMQDIFLKSERYGDKLLTSMRWMPGKTRFCQGGQEMSCLSR